MEPSTPKLTEAARGTLKALRREFRRCSNQYPALYHEQWQPHHSLAEYDLEEVCGSFRKAFAEELGDGWQEWNMPDDVEVSSFGRYFGSGDGLSEFETLAESVYWVVGAIDFRPADLGESFVVSFNAPMFRSMLPERGDRGYDDWLSLLYRIGLEYPSPLLTCGHRMWALGKGPDDASIDSLGQKEGGSPFPLHPYHLFIRQPLFAASVAAIDIILGKPRFVAVGAEIDPDKLLAAFEELENADFAAVEELEQADGGKPPSQPRRLTVQAEESLQWPVLDFTLIGENWHLKFDTGHGIEEHPFPDYEGFCVYAKLLRNPNIRISPEELEGMVLPEPDPEELKKLAEQGEFSFVRKGSDEDMAPQEVVIAVRGAIRKLEQLLRITKEQGRQAEIRERLQAFLTYYRSITNIRGKARKFRSEGFGKSQNRISANRTRANQRIAIYMPEFAKYLQRHVKQSYGFFAYWP